MKQYIALLLLLLVTIVFSLTTGSISIPLAEMFSEKYHTIIFEIRIPRMANAITVGALLSVSGLMIQNLVKNPLADPYILGVSGASAMVQLLLIAFGIVLPFSLFMLTGFMVTLLALLLLLLISSKKSLNSTNLLLSGVVLAFAYSAIISLILTLSPTATTKPILFWLMGDLGYSSFSLFPIIALVIGSLSIFRYHKELDLLARGEFFALKCGVNVRKTNLVLLVSASLFTAVAVSLAGTIGFVGLVIPHISRLIFGNKHAKLIPASIILGATLVLLADTLSRWLFAPTQLPVGIFTALFGVPVFLYLLRKNS